MVSIMHDFSYSDECRKYEKGCSFDEAILAFMARFYGSFDEFKNNELKDLREVYDFMMKE